MMLATAPDGHKLIIAAISSTSEDARMRRALSLLVLLAACGPGATPTTCRIKYVDRWNRPEKYKICMERWEIRNGRHAAMQPQPPTIITQQVPVNAPLITAFVDGEQRVCRLSSGGAYVCDPLGR